MKTLKQEIEIKSSPEKVFAYADDIHNTGWHMSKSSMPMMGSKLKLEILSKNPTGEGAVYRWSGKVMGLTIDFSEIVTKWVKNKERVWKTIGQPKIIIISNYEMWFFTDPSEKNTKLTFGISYDLPKDIFGFILGFLLADWYSKWCLNNMCQGAKDALENTSVKQHLSHTQA